MSDESTQLTIEAFDLASVDNLKIAIELAPELFAALRLARELGESVYPITTGREAQSLLARLIDNDAFESCAIRITPRDCVDRFPSEFFPILDRGDFIRKVYMAVVIAHESESRLFLEEVRSGTRTIAPSHPFDLARL